MNIDYNAVIEILKSFLNNEKVEILGISVGEERQVREAIKNLLTAYEKEKEKREKLEYEALEAKEYIEGLKAYKDRVNALKAEFEKEKEKNKELESDIQQKNFEIKCLNSDIKNMYCEEGVIAILEDNFCLSRDEAISILEEE